MHSSIWFSLFIDKSLWTQICEIVNQCYDQIKWAAHHMVSRIPNPIFWSLFHESQNQIILKKRETTAKRVKFFWFARKLFKIQFTVLRICENMGGLILYQKSFCHMQVKQTAHSIVSKIFNSFPQIRWFWQRKTTTKQAIFLFE